MKNTLYEGYEGKRMPRQELIRRVKQVMDQELTPIQRQTLAAYYLHGKNIPQIAKDRGVNKSTVCRTLHRAEKILRKFLKY